ncbi:MAG TPA: NAD(P)-dependent oxidoreductase [Desulfomonilia bacterium]|nr:NAD(P)-dependent oxidoreductase [Desulfomonilia bacterium]
MDVIFYEVFEEEEEALRRYLPEGMDAGFMKETIQESGHGSPPSPLISMRTQSSIPQGWVPDIKAVLTRSTGFDHVVSYLTASGALIKAGYLPLYCSRAVAEQALLLWLGLMRKITSQIAHLPHFNRDGLTGMECAGRTLAVAGVGNIGSEICRIGEALGMEVMGVDIVERHPSIRYVSIEEAIIKADVICCAMNLTGRNKGYFTYDLLKRAKPGAIFVNVARGELAPADDLLKLLDERHLGGVGLDVYENEADLAAALRSGAAMNDPAMRAVLDLMNRENAILTPHNAFNTRESVERKASMSIFQIENFLKYGEFIWKVPL